jgi:putative spermidine/putrescine transport system permease protein
MTSVAESVAGARGPKLPRVAVRPDPISLLALPAALYLGLVFAVPLGLVLLTSLSTPSGVGLGSYVSFLADPYNLHVIGNSLKLALITTLICVVVGYPTAFVMARAPGWLQLTMLALIFLPLTVSVVVKSFGWTILLRRTGLVNQVLLAIGVIDEPLMLMFTEPGLFIGTVNVFLPFMVLPLFSVIRLIDPRLAEAAAVLGTGPIGRFLRVWLPLSVPGIVAGGALVFSLAVSAWLTPTLLAGERYMTLSMVVAKAFLFLQDRALGSTVAVLLLALAIAIISLSAWLQRRYRPEA